MKTKQIINKYDQITTIPILDSVLNIKTIDTHNKWQCYRIKRLNDNIWLESNSTFNFEPNYIKIFIENFKEKDTICR